jgi:hypothetical protein
VDQVRGTDNCSPADVDKSDEIMKIARTTGEQVEGVDAKYAGNRLMVIVVWALSLRSATGWVSGVRSDMHVACDIDPGAPLMIASLLAYECNHVVPQSFCLNDIEHVVHVSDILIHPTSKRLH